MGVIVTGKIMRKGMKREHGETERVAAEVERGVNEAIDGLQELEEYFEMTQSNLLLEPIVSPEIRELKFPEPTTEFGVFMLKAA